MRDAMRCRARESPSAARKIWQAREKDALMRQATARGVKAARSNRASARHARKKICYDTHKDAQRSQRNRTMPRDDAQARCARRVFIMRGGARSAMFTAQEQECACAMMPQRKPKRRARQRGATKRRCDAINRRLRHGCRYEPGQRYVIRFRRRSRAVYVTAACCRCTAPIDAV